MTSTLAPRIYVASLADYNAGRLHGRWIDADQEPEDIYSEISEMLRESSEPIAEEWAIHDHEDFGGFSPHEFAQLEDIATIAQRLADPTFGTAYAAYLDHEGGLEYADPDDFEDAYHGQWASEQDYATDLFDELYLHDLPEHLHYYIDYEKFAHDLFLSDCYSVDDGEGGVFVFWRH